MNFSRIVQLLFRVPDGYFDQFLETDNCGSPVTVFAFAGAAGLYFGRFTQRGVTPSFEFRKVLRQHGGNYNLVFFRDLHRSYYHLTPDGEPGGLAFYADKVRELTASLGSTYNVAIGSSMGGGAALYFGARCRMDQVIAFSPSLPELGRCPWNPQRASEERLFLLRSPWVTARYLAHMTTTVLLDWRFHQLASQGQVWPVLGQYRMADSPTKATIYYGQGSFHDQCQIRPFAGCPQVQCVPIPTVRHNCASMLKEQGKLASTISRIIERGLAKQQSL